MLLALLGVRARLDPDARLEIELAPGRVQDLATARAGQKQQPYRIGALLLGMRVQGGAKALQLGRGQVAGPPVLRVALDPASKGCVSTQPHLMAKLHIRDPRLATRFARINRPAFVIWRCRWSALFVCDARDLGVAESVSDVAGRSVLGVRSRGLARQMVALVTGDQIGDGRRPPVFLALLERINVRGRSIA